MSEYLIEYKGMSKAFPKEGGGTNLVLNNINLRIRKGEFVALIGGSGSGKSTLFNHLLGSLEPSSGVVLVDGTNVSGEGPDRGIVPQAYSLYPFKRVVDNIGFGKVLSDTSVLQRVLHTPKYLRTLSQARREATALLPELGLDPGSPDQPWPATSLIPFSPLWKARREHESNTGDCKRWPFELSGGMQQRVAIGTALIKQPTILMMDEPFGALDPETRSKLQKLTLRKWQEMGLTIIFVTHMMEEAVFLASRIVGLSKFWLDADGKPGKGATIVLDKEVTEPRGADGSRSDGFMDTPEFHDVCTHIHRLVLDTTRRVSMDQRELTHPDASSA